MVQQPVIIERIMVMGGGPLGASIASSGSSPSMDWGVPVLVPRRTSPWVITGGALVVSEGRSVAEVLGDPESLAERALAGQAPVPSPWDELVGPFFRSEGVQARLGISRQAVAAKAARRRLLRVFTSDGVALFPAWQFDGPQVIPGLGAVLSVFPEAAVDGWTVAGWLRTPDADLDGAVPLELLVAGEAERVLTVARSASRALAA